MKPETLWMAGGCVVTGQEIHNRLLRQQVEGDAQLALLEVNLLVLFEYLKV